MSKTARWIESRLPAWREAARQAEAVERGRSASAADVLGVVRAYPEIARDVAIARALAPSAPLTRRLERLYLVLHRTLHERPRRLPHEIASLILRDAPAAARALAWHIVWVTALFFASATAGAWLVNQYPEVVGLFASEAMIEQVQAGRLWTDGLLNVVPSSVLAVSIFTNNITVALFALVVGIFYGLGTAYIVGMNGMMLGAVFSYTAQHGLAVRLLEFVAAHGFVELSVVMIAGACGVSLGEALARPGHLRRAEAFRRATKRAVPLLVVGAVFLVGAGLIEGYVSPSPAYPFWARLAIGFAYLGLLVVVLSGALERLVRRRRRLPAASGEGPAQMRRVARN